MTERDDENDDASDWLAAQFAATGEVPKPKKPDAAGPPAQTPLQPQMPPAPQAPLQPQMPPAPPPAAPVAPAAPPPPAAPAYPQAPAQPTFPPSAAPAAPQQPLFPPQQPAAQTPQQPVPQQPAFPVQQQPPQQPPAQQPPVQQQPAPPVQPAQPAGGFSWGLTPGGAPDAPAAQPPAAPPPAAPPPAAPPPAAPPPAATPPAAPPPAATPPADPSPVAPPGPFYRPVSPDPAPVDPAIGGAPGIAAEPPAVAMPFETTVLPDVAPDAADAPPFWEPEPTQMMDAVELEQAPPPRVPQPVPTSVFPPQTRSTETFGVDEAGPSDTEQVSAIDALFGDSQFRDYTDGLDPSQNPFVRKAEADSGREPFDPTDPAGPKGPPPGVSRVQRILLSVLGGILALLALVALFFVGARLPDLLGPAPAIATPTGTPSPSASPGLPLGPVAVGEHAWDELLGRECLDPYTDPWQTTYVVVECTDPHPAQMVHRGIVPPEVVPPGAYPGEEAMQTAVIALCRAAGIFDPSVVVSYTDMVIETGYPTEEAWIGGSRDFYCFATRSSGELITGDLTLAPVVPVTPEEPAP